MLEDTPAEKAVLSLILKHGHEAYSDISHLLGNGEHFTLAENRELYQVLQYAFAENSKVEPDLFLIQSVAKQIGLTSILEVDNSAYIQRLFHFSGERSNLVGFAKKIRKLGVARDIQAKLKDSSKSLDKLDGSETIIEIITLAEGPLLDYINLISGQNNEGIQPISEGLDVYLKDLIDNPRTLVGTSSGYPRYDKAIGGGLRRKSVNVVAARMKVGKSQFGANVALHVAGKLEIPTLYLDTEMDREGLWPRLVANLSKVTVDEIEEGQFGKKEESLKRVRAAYKTLKKMPLDYMNVSGNTFDEIISIMRRWVNRRVGIGSDGMRKDCLIVFDYLKMMGADSDKLESANESQVLGFQITKLNAFVVENDIPCLTFVQVNRDGIENESTSIIADSDKIARYCANIALLKEKTGEEIEADGGYGTGNRKLHILITRFGRGLEPRDYINMSFRGQYAEITEGLTRNEHFKGVKLSGTGVKGFEEVEMSDDESTEN